MIYKHGALHSSSFIKNKRPPKKKINKQVASTSDIELENELKPEVIQIEEEMIIDEVIVENTEELDKADITDVITHEELEAEIVTAEFKEKSKKKKKYSRRKKYSKKSTEASSLE
jgi:hypothetical protein